MEDENNNQYLDRDGKVAFVPLEDFESKVSNGQVCFLCANELIVRTQQLLMSTLSRNGY